MVPSWLILAYVAVFGLIVGSYLNVVIYRLPRGISTVMPRSRCPACGAPIRALDNLPVLSFLLLRRPLPRLRSAHLLALSAARGGHGAALRRLRRRASA